MKTASINSAFTLAVFRYPTSSLNYIYTGTSLKPTASVHTPLTLAVDFSEPPVYLFYTGSSLNESPVASAKNLEVALTYHQIATAHLIYHCCSWL
jgi:hypothetical protein